MKLCTQEIKDLVKINTWNNISPYIMDFKIVEKISDDLEMKIFSDHNFAYEIQNFMLDDDDW